MNTFSRTRTLSALTLGIACALAFSSSAHAAAFQLKENSAKGLGRAFAGSISAPGDASVVGGNPAAMRHLDGRQFQADLSVISFSAEFNGRGDYLNGSTPLPPISGGDGGDAGKIAPVPAAYFHVPFGENDQYHFGTSLHVPFGFGTKYDRDWMGRYNATKTDLQAIDLSFAFSYDVNPYLSFGASVFVEHLSIELQSAVDFGSILAAQGLGVLGFRPGSHDGDSTIKGSNNAVGFTLGGLFSFTENTHLGLSFRSKVTHKIDDGQARFTVPTAAASILNPNRLFIDTTGRAEVSLPAVMTASLTHAINDRWTVMADVSHTRWETAFDRVTVRFGSNQPPNNLEFNYQNTTFGSIGAEYKLSNTVTLRSGIAYDPTPTTYEDRDVRVPDQTRKWLSLGLSWTPSEKVEYNFGYTHLFVSDPRVDTVNGTGNRMRGSFDVNGDIFAASMNYKF